MNVLFICTGNTCRSPMAEALSRREIHKRGLAGWWSASAGVMANPGSPATDLAAEEMNRRGLSLRGHRSRMVTADDIEGADCILAMTADHRDMLLRRFPQGMDRTYTLGDFAGTREEVPDPMGRGREAYRRCADRLDILVREAMDRLTKE